MWGQKSSTYWTHVLLGQLQRRSSSNGSEQSKSRAWSSLCPWVWFLGEVLGKENRTSAVHIAINLHNVRDSCVKVGDEDYVIGWWYPSYREVLQVTTKSMNSQIKVSHDNHWQLTMYAETASRQQHTDKIYTSLCLLSGLSLLKLGEGDLSI